MPRCLPKAPMTFLMTLWSVMCRKTLLPVLTLVIILTGHPPEARAATINTASCSPTDVQTAVNAAASGDTVVLPACTYTNWDTTVNITQSLTLAGQGRGQTILQRARIAAAYDSNPMLRVSNVTGFALRNLTLDGTYDTDPNTWVDMGIVLSTVVDFLIHDMAFHNLAVAIQLFGDPTVQRGVIHHNTFTDIYYSTENGSFGYGVSVNGSGTYPALTLGTAQNVFIEDNTFTRNRHTVASNNGSLYVFRYNTIIDNRENAAAIDTHGFTGVWPRGSRQYEIYNNTVNNSVARYAGVSVWGGDGVIFNNVFSPNINEEVQVQHEGGCTGTYPRQDQIRDLYIWGNTLIGGGAAPIFVACPTYTQLDRDYFTTLRPGYTPYTYPHPLAQRRAAPTMLRVVP